MFLTSLKNKGKNPPYKPHSFCAKPPQCLKKLVTPQVRLGLSGRNPRRHSGISSGNALRAFLGSFPSGVRPGSPKPCKTRHLKAPEHFQNSLPPQYGWGRLFFQKWFRRGPLRAGHGIPSSTGGIPAKS